MSHNADVEKDYATNGSHLDGNMDTDNALNRIRTAGSISISPELFEKIYLSPQNKVKGDLRKTFGNPTPIALVGFLLSLSPLACDLMGWRGAGGNGAASTGAYYGFGFVLMFVGGLLEWVLGNTFPAVVFTSFGAFWFTFGSTLVPTFNAYGAYVAEPSDAAATGLETVGFNASFAFFLVTIGLLCLVYLIASLRTNVVFVVIFLTLVGAFICLSAAFWMVANSIAAGAAGDMGAVMSNTSMAANFQLAGGALTFVTCAAGWYLFFIQVLASVDFPLNLPVGDLSTVIKGASQK